MLNVGYGQHFDVTEYLSRLGLFPKPEEIFSGITESGNMCVLMAEYSEVTKRSWPFDEYTSERVNIVTYHHDPEAAAQAMLYFLNRYKTDKRLCDYKTSGKCTTIRKGSPHVVKFVNEFESATKNA